MLSHLHEPIEIYLTSLHKEGVDDNFETAESQLDSEFRIVFRIASSERTLISNFPNIDSEEFIILIAPVVGQRPVSMFNDGYCEELAHPHLFLNGKFG